MVVYRKLPYKKNFVFDIFISQKGYIYLNIKK